MAMTPPSDSFDQSTSGALALQDASDQLRGRSRQRAVEIADDVLRNALRSSRHSMPVRIYPPHGHVLVSDQVIISVLRRDIDAALAGAAVGRIYLVVDRSQSLRELTVELFVQYGQVLLDLADRARTIADLVLAQLLSRSEVAVDVVARHVHISDITTGDPHLVDPTDELDP